MKLNKKWTIHIRGISLLCIFHLKSAIKFPEHLGTRTFSYQTWQRRRKIRKQRSPKNKILTGNGLSYVT